VFICPTNRDSWRNIMSKAMGSWSGMRKYLEKDMLAATFVTTN
jgi:hypothetical protein